MVPPEKKFRDRSKSTPEVHVMLCCRVVLLVCDILVVSWLLCNPTCCIGTYWYKCLFPAVKGFPVFSQVCVCTCMCVWVCMCMYTCVLVCTLFCPCMRVYIHVCVCVNKGVYVFLWVSVYVCDAIDISVGICYQFNGPYCIYHISSHADYCMYKPEL